ncbi:glutathione S-transferase family protein [Phenylobacterium immobile]|uniref:glutathione S-transferase family protein n=1 Tax=Phenylobacterium immobile TaxID=21 RepID=UPI000A9E8AC3|nr:glutathione S-transferase family protein [Phenylobacterium immobile]
MSATGLTIYGAHFSRAARCIWLAEELGVAFEHDPIAYADPALKAPPYVTRAPMGKVPAIDDHGFELWESMAINYYLANQAPNALWPADVRSQALIMQWSFWGMAEVEKAGIAAGLHTGILPAEQRNPETLAGGMKVLAKPLSVLELALHGRDYLLGADFSLADLNAASIMWPMHAGKTDLTAWPRAAAWLDRCLTRPAAINAFALP